MGTHKVNKIVYGSGSVVADLLNLFFSSIDQIFCRIRSLFSSLSMSFSSDFALSTTFAAPAFIFDFTLLATSFPLSTTFFAVSLIL